MALAKSCSSADCLPSSHGAPEHGRRQGGSAAPLDLAFLVSSTMASSRQWYMDSSETPADGTGTSTASLETQSSQVRTVHVQQRCRNKTDPAWAHGVEIEIEENGKVKKWIRCMYCNEVLKGGGIHRLKLHLAGEKGEVKQCTHVSVEVRHEMQQSVENFNEEEEG
ncbi:hypothetical protein ACQ4PT_061605 [Festuca glaucescens]